MTYRDAFYIYKVQKTHVSVFYHKPNSDMWESQRGFFLAPRAPHSRRHFTERASLEVRTSATRTDATVTDANDDAVFFYFFKSRAHPRFGGRRVRSFVRSIVRSINRRRANAFRILSFPGTTDGCAFALRDAIPVDGCERRCETEFVVFESVRVFRPSVRR